VKSGIKALFFLRRIGPYHHARFEAVPPSTLSLVAVETRPNSNEYPWVFEISPSYICEKFPILSNPEQGIKGSLLKATIKKCFDKYNPTVVITTGWADHEYHAVVLEAHRRKLPILVISDSRFEDENRKFYKEWLKRIILKSYSAALVAGQASRNYLIKLGFKSSSIFQPWDVVDNLHFSKELDSYQEFNQRDFICVSRFIQKKNLSKLLYAFARYRDMGGNRKLKLLGSGILEGELRNLVSVLNLDKIVTFHGFVNYHDLVVFLKKSFCLILPSLTDQWGLVVNEAMAAGLPVLVSKNCGCTLDLVEDGFNGFAFDPHEINEIASVLTRMDNFDEIQWKKMGERSELIIANWSLKAFSFSLVMACNEALKHSVKNKFKLFHILLSK
jgi:glycosyltransferase involved in cell wall biosynthesis